MSLYLEPWEIEAVQGELNLLLFSKIYLNIKIFYLGFVLTTLSTDEILNSNLRDNLLYSIGRLSYPELMIATKPEKLSLIVDQYIKHIVSFKLKVK